MKLLRTVGLLVVLTLVLSVGQVLAETEDPPTPGDILFYESFDGAFDTPGDRLATGWATWSRKDLCGCEGQDCVCHDPEYKQANPFDNWPYRARGEAGNAQQWHTSFSGHYGGIKKKIDVPPNAVVQVSAWASTWSSPSDDPHAESSSVRMMVGVDHDGGDDVTAPWIAWSAPVYPPNNDFVMLGPVVITNTDAAPMTVYVVSNPKWGFKHNDVYVDDVAVTYLGAARPAVPLAEDASAGAASGGEGGDVLASASGAVGGAAPDPVLQGLVEEPEAAVTGSGGLLTWILPTLLGIVVLGSAIFRRQGKD